MARPTIHPSPRDPARPATGRFFVMVLLLTGCGGEPADSPVASVPPKKAATQLEEAFPEESTTEAFVSARMASEALKEGQYEKAVVALHATRSATNLTLDQGLAVHNSLVTLEQTLIQAAANGDANAQRAYDLLKKSKRN